MSDEVLPQKSRKFFTLALLLILTRGFDVVTTRIYTPDLSRETNIIVKLFHADFQTSVIIQVAVVMVIIYCLHNYCYKKIDFHRFPGNLSFGEFIAYFHTGFLNYWRIFIPTKRIKKYSTTISLGYIVTHSLIWIGFIVGTSTTMLIISENYRRLYNLGGPYFLYAVIIAITVYFMQRFYHIQFKAYTRYSETHSKY